MTDIDSAFSPEFLAEADSEYQLAQIAGQARALADGSGLTRRALARRMGVSTSTLQKLVSEGNAHVNLETLARLAAACGRRLTVAFEGP